ncbi:MAG: hypothetical protein JXX28_01825 [Deltaproteobacteria bacterium]|nr:hypothetical protein [Deltaproteobacteria bacterium]
MSGVAPPLLSPLSIAALVLLSLAIVTLWLAVQGLGIWRTATDLEDGAPGPLALGLWAIASLSAFGGPLAVVVPPLLALPAGWVLIGVRRGARSPADRGPALATLLLGGWSLGVGVAFGVWYALLLR